MQRYSQICAIAWIFHCEGKYYFESILKINLVNPNLHYPENMWKFSQYKFDWDWLCVLLTYQLAWRNDNYKNFPQIEEVIKFWRTRLSVGSLNFLCHQFSKKSNCKTDPHGHVLMDKKYWIVALLFWKIFLFLKNRDWRLLAPGVWMVFYGLQK